MKEAEALLVAEVQAAIDEILNAMIETTFGTNFPEDGEIVTIHT